MKKRGVGIACVAMLVLLHACGLREVGGDGMISYDDNAWFGPGIQKPGSATGNPGKTTWYAVAADYTDGYDWRKDSDKGQVRCSLVVFANGVPVMKIAAGDKYEVSTDPDASRMIDGVLYTDYSTETETVIRKNGSELFRFPVREMICDMVVEGDDVYTLGHSRDEGGFSFRKNGEVLLERPSGYTFSRIQRDSSGLSFAFCESIVSGSGAMERYSLVKDGTSVQVAVREDVKRVWDIMVHEGEICYIADFVGIKVPVLVVGNAMYSLQSATASDVISCRFLTGGLEIFVEQVVRSKGHDMQSVIWKHNKVHTSFLEGQTLASHCVVGDELCCVTTGFPIIRPGVILAFGESYSVPANYMSMGGQTMAVKDGMLYVGLTSSKGDCPAVWVDGEMKPLKINGFISHVHVY